MAKLAAAVSVACHVDFSSFVLRLIVIYHVFNYSRHVHYELIFCLFSPPNQKPVASPRGHIQLPAESKLEGGNDVKAMEAVTDSETEEWSDTMEGNSTLGTGFGHS